MMDLCATVNGSVCAAMIYRFVKTKKKEHLVIALVTFLCAVLAIVRFVMGH